MSNFNIEVDDEEARRALRVVAAAYVDLRPFWPRVVPLFIGWMREQFQTEGTFGGERWAPLSPRYLSWKLAKYPGKGILYAEGDLRQAASQPDRRTTPTMLELTIRDPKLEYHQTGTTKMPARPLIFDELPIQAALQLEEAAEDYVEGVARRAGFR